MRFERRFSWPEVERIVTEADRRIANHPQTRTVGPDRVRNERIGVASEWAVCEWVGIPEDPVFEDHGAGGDGGVDLVLPDGRRVEVKATIYGGGRLIIPVYQGARDFDLAVLCLRSAPATITACGYATREDWEKHQYLLDFHRGVGPQPVMDQGRLRPFADIVTNTGE